MMASEGKTMFMFTVVWRGSRRTLLLAVGLVTALVLSSAFAQESAVACRTVPNALLSIVHANGKELVGRAQEEQRCTESCRPLPRPRPSISTYKQISNYG